MDKIKAFCKSLPLWLQKGITDFVETGIAAVAALVFVLPQNMEDAKKVAVLVAAAIAGAAISAVRRASPDFVAWFKSFFVIAE